GQAEKEHVVFAAAERQIEPGQFEAFGEPFRRRRHRQAFRADPRAYAASPAQAGQTLGDPVRTANAAPPPPFAAEKPAEAALRRRRDMGFDRLAGDLRESLFEPGQQLDLPAGGAGATSEQLSAERRNADRAAQEKRISGPGAAPLEPASLLFSDQGD